MNICNLGTWAGSIHVRGAPAPIMLTSPISIAVWCLRGAAVRVLMYLIIDSTQSYETMDELTIYFEIFEVYYMY